MIPNVATRETSFKGAGAYLLHDKSNDNEPHRTTDERVAWTQTRNLTTDDPDLAMRIIAATAMDKDRLKEQAGVRKSGRQSKGEVYHYSLAWYPDENGKIDRAEMLNAVDQSIKALGAEKHQAVFVAHNDEAHPHVHVVVNLVNPENGKNLSLSNDRRKLDKWAYEYRKQRGEHEIYCKDRSTKHEAIAEKERGQDQEFKRGSKSRSRSQIEADKKLESVEPQARQTWETEQVGKNRELSDYGRTLHSRQRNQWDALNDNYRLRKNNISREYRKGKGRANEAIKEQMKPQFTGLYRQQWQERQRFEERDKRIVGKVQNILKAVNHAKTVRGEQPNIHVFKKMQNLVRDAGNRAAWLSARQQDEVKALRGEEKGRIRYATQSLNQTRQNRMTAARQDYGLERGALIGKHNAERQDLRQRWKARHVERAAALDRLLFVTGHSRPLLLGECQV